MELEFDVKINAGILYDYLLHHTYTSFSGLLGTVVGVLALVMYYAERNILYLIAGVVILLYLPWTLYLKSKQQMVNSKVFKEPLHYKMTDEGMEVSQGEAKEMQEWDKMYKAVSTRKSIILYTSPVNASVFPRKDLGDKTSVLIQMISTHMPPAKVKIRG